MTEEVLPQYEFAESYQENGTAYRTSPAPFGGTLPKGEGFGCTINYNLNEMFCILQKIPSYVILNLSKFNKKGDEYAGN